MEMIKVAEFKTQKGFWYKVKGWISSPSSSVRTPYAGRIRLRVNYTNGTQIFDDFYDKDRQSCEFFSEWNNSVVEVFLDKKDIEDLSLLKFVLESYSTEKLHLDLKS